MPFARPAAAPAEHLTAPRQTLRLGLDPKAVLIAGLLHVLAFATPLVFWPTWERVGLCLGLYVVRVLGVTVGFHRYFSHRAFETSRWFGAVLAFWGGLAAQRSAVWWAAHHRVHHRRSDLPGDVHSPVEGSLFWAHMGWWLDASSEQTRWEAVKDWSQRPELRWLDRHHLVPQTLLALGLYAAGGWAYVLWGWALNTVLVWHGLSLLNSWCHRWGRRPFATKDQSRNSFVVGLLAMGEGWHNNHHRYPASPRHGLHWWQVDVSWWVIGALSLVGLIQKLQPVPAPANQT